MVLPADADGHAPGLERIQDLGVGAMTFPAAGSAADLALLLADHHGASLIVTAGHTASIEAFFDRTRQHSNPSTFLTRLRVGEKLVDAKAVATLYRNRISGGAIALLVLTMLLAVIAALWVSRTDAVVMHWVADYWNHFSLWVAALVSTRTVATMISFRQHAISLAAVFLALAVGVVLGSGFLSDTLLSGLRDEKRDLHNQINVLNDQKNALNEKLALPTISTHRWPAGSCMTRWRQVGGGLPHPRCQRRRRRRGVEDHRPGRRRGHRNGGADAGIRRRQLRGEAAFGGQLAGPARRCQLSTKLVDQGSQAGDLLGIALLINANPAVPPSRDDAQRDTVLAALRDTGFITYSPPTTSARRTPRWSSPAARCPSDAGNQGVTVARFAAALAPHGSGTLLAGRDGSATGAAAVAVTRADASMTSAISTVDDVDAASGRITAVLGLHDLINGGHAGQYGTGHGATSVTVPQ